MRRGNTSIIDAHYCELLMGDGFQTPRRFLRFAYARRLILTNLRRYLYSLDSLVALGLFSSAAAALIGHKLMIIRLHRPLSVLGLVVTGPCLFVFDLMTLIILHYGLSSSKLLLKGISGIVALLLMVCSATFASLYLEGNTELNWTRSVEAHFSYRGWLITGPFRLEIFQKTHGSRQQWFRHSFRSISTCRCSSNTFTIAFGATIRQSLNKPGDV
jgi:hypothetical protein